MIATYLLPDTVSCFPSTLRLEIRSNKSQLLSYVEIKQTDLQFWNTFYVARNEKNPQALCWENSLHLKRDFGERCFQVFSGRWACKPKPWQTGLGEEREKPILCGLFSLKNTSVVFWELFLWALTYFHLPPGIWWSTLLNDSIVMVGNKFPHWQRLDFRMLFTALDLTVSTYLGGYSGFRSSSWCCLSS